MDTLDRTLEMFYIHMITNPHHRTIRKWDTSRRDNKIQCIYLQSEVDSKLKDTQKFAQIPHKKNKKGQINLANWQYNTNTKHSSKFL